MNFNPTLDELARLEHMDVRSTNTCRKAGIKDLKALLDYYQYNERFATLPNCGRKTEMHLEKICLKYASEHNSEARVNLTVHRAWTDEELVAIETFIRIKMTSVRRRACNRLNLELQDLGVKGFMEKILNPGFNFINMKHIGRVSLVELEDFRSALRHELLRLHKEKSDLNNRFF